MSFLHYLFLGHFEHDGPMVRFSKRPSDAVYRPVVCRPLDTQTLKAVLREIHGSEAQELLFPDDWTIGMDEGYLVCDKYTRNPEEINFITRVVERTRCEILDVGAHAAITLPDWLAVAHSYSNSTPRVV
jgi:hypothetical protein